MGKATPPMIDNTKLMEKIKTIKALAAESEALLQEPSPDLERLIATLQAQSRVQQILLDKLVEMVEPTDKEKDLNDTFQQAVQELLAYFEERARLAGKVADAAALKHLRKG